MYQTDTVKVKTDCKDSRKIWSKISDISSMKRWADGVKDVTITSKNKKGLGTVRRIKFDNSIVNERIIGWKQNTYLSYIAIDGLPVDWYHSTMTLDDYLTWESYFGSEKMSRIEFKKFKEFLINFYTKSLNNLNVMI